MEKAQKQGVEFLNKKQFIELAKENRMTARYNKEQNKQASSAEVQVTTIQETGKGLKLQIMLSVGMIIVGMIWLFSDFKNLDPEKDTFLAPSLVTLVGLVWYLVTKFRIWWHHK